MASVTKTTTSTGEIRYVVRYRDPNGKSREIWKRRKEDADRYARNIETDIDRGAYVDPAKSKITFGEWSAKWMKTKAHRKPKTVVGYKSLLDTHIKDTNRPLNPAVNSMPIRIFMSIISAASMSSATTPGSMQ